MTATTDISSNALNFLSHLQNGVDPRTGLYTLFVTLPTPTGNDLLGPELDLALRYSPLNTHDSGYGKGWNLQLSQFDPDPQRRIVSLASGETYKATGRIGTTNQLAMQEKKIDSFHLYEESDSRWRLVHRSGQVEILETQGSGSNRRALPVQVFNEQGQWLKLEYAGFNNGFARLAKVTDMRGETLLQIARESALVTLTFQTDVGSAAYSLVLVDADRKVGRIELPTENKASWRIKYSRERNLDCISQVYTPTGGFEEVFYQDGGHLFPIGSGIEPLPRVTRHLNHPSHGQPTIETRYTFSSDEHNFLGGNVALQWQDDGLDNLFRKVMEYNYGTTETLWVDGKPVRSIERTFNKFHLVTAEATCHGSMLSDDGKTVVGNNILEKITTYNLKTGLYSEQSNNCQLPHKVQTRWRLRNDATRSRSEQVASTYDDYGNLLTHQAANGVVETSLWYKAEEDGYPGDPEGFVKHLKQKIVTPAANLPGAAPTLVTTYRYERFPVLACSAAESGQGQWLALQSETLAGERELNTIHYSYYVQEQESPGPDKPMTHGRVRSRTSAFPLTTKAADVQGATLDTCAEYTYEYKTIDWDSLVALATSDSRGDKRAPEWFEATRMLYTQRQITGFDTTCKTTAQGVSLTTGEVLLDLDEDNVARITQFDSLGRMVCQIVAPGSASEATRSERYHLCANEQEQADQRSTDSLGVMVTQHFDGVGRVVQETRDHLDPAQPKRQLPILSRRYDAWGRELAVSQHDWLDGQPYPAPEQLQTTEYRYDAWGERSLILRADGVQEHVSFDPTETDKDNNVFKTRWLQAPRQTLKSEKVRTAINVFEKPLLIERLGLDDTPQAAQKLSYDGLGRCISKTDERGNTTRLEYDAFDRMTANVLPDDGRIEWQYAAHSGAELPVSIVVISNTGSLPRYQVGSQTFDGLDRLTSRKVGKRLEQLLHTSAQSAPVSMTTGAGDSVGFTYKLELSPLPVSSSAIDDHAVFEYHPLTSLLTKSMNAQGQREYEYDLSNHLTFEHWSNLGGDRLTTAYSTSLHGRLAKRTDAGAAVTTHRYDELGRTKTIEQGNVVAGFDYDSLGRLIKVVCTDQANDSALTTDLAYDEHGRERQRTQQLDGQPARILMQTWGNDGLLDARELKEGGTTLHKEQFLYDVRGRLRTVNYSGLLLPEDNEGRSVVKQVFRFDALDNVTTAMTTFADATSATTVYTYDEHDRCQLAGLTITQADQTTIELSFSHDANGNLQIDEQGRELRYDSQNRLLEIEPSSRYRYDGLGQLVASSAGEDQESLLWFDGEQLSLAMKGATATRYCRLQDLPLAQQTHDPAATLLLQTSASHSVIAESNAGRVRSATYLAHGQRDGASLLDSHLGFNGEALDAGSGWYLLGNGYRAYNPALMRFTSPDSESPFDTGGLNPYVYCLGNPVTLRDPTGHSASAAGRPRRPDEDDPNWLGRRPGGGDTLKWVWLGVAVIATIAAVVTAGASLAAVGAFGAAAAASVAAAGASVAAGAQVGLGTALLAKFAGTTLTAALMSTATAALAVAGTGAQAVAAIGNDQTAGAWAGYLGLASIGLGVANGLRSAGGALVGRFLARGGSKSAAASLGLPGAQRGSAAASDLGAAAQPSFLHGQWAQPIRFQRIRSQFQQRRWLNHFKEAGLIPNRFQR